MKQRPIRFLLDQAEVKAILEAFGEVKAIGRLKTPLPKKKSAGKAGREYVAEFSNLIIALACVSNLNDLVIFGKVCRWVGEREREKL